MCSGGEASDSVCRGLGGNRKRDWTASPALYAAGTLLQVDRSPPACSQISTCSPKSTRGEAEKRLPSFAPGPLMPLQIWCQSPRFQTNLRFGLRSLVIPTFLFIQRERKRLLRVTDGLSPHEFLGFFLSNCTDKIFGI